MLDFQLSTFIFQTINFFILLAALTWFLYRPLLRVMKKREDDIAAQLNDANEKARQADEERQNLAEETRRARQQSEALLAQARTEASHAKEESLEQARVEASQLMADARRRIQEQERAAERRLQARLVDSAVGMAGGLIRRAAGSALHKALVDELVTDGVGLEPDQVALLQQAVTHGDEQITVEIAYPSTPEVEKRIRETLGRQLGKDEGSLLVSFKEEPSLLAGARILVSSVAVDLSLRRTLAELARSSNPGQES